MAPPFSTGNEEDKPRKGRNATRLGPSTPLTDAVTTQPEHIDQILDDKNDKKKGDKKGQKEEEAGKKKKPYYNRYEQPRKINKVTLEIPLILETPPALVPTPPPTPPQQEEEDDQTNNNNDDRFPSSLTRERLPQVKLSKNSRCSISCHVPPSKPNGRWTGSMSANSTVYNSIGSTNGSLDLSCRVSPTTRVMGGLAITTKTNPTRPLQAHIGAQYMDPTSQDMIQVTAKQYGTNNSTNNWSLHVLIKEVRDPWIVTSNFLCNMTTNRDWSIVFAVTSMTTHVVRLGLGISKATLLQTQQTIASAGMMMMMPFLSTVVFSIDPRLSSNRRAPLSISYQPGHGTWQGSLAFQTSRKQQQVDSDSASSKSFIPSSWRIAIQQGKTSSKKSAKTATASSSSSSLLANNNWSIIVSWQHGDFTLRIPILLGTLAGMTTTATTGNNNNTTTTSTSTTTLVAMATPYLIMAIVGVANELLSQVLWGTNYFSTTDKSTTAADTSSAATSKAVMAKVTKAKEDAAAQQKLMERTAQSRKANQEEKGGLVIQSAIYRFGNNDDNNNNEEICCWDVAIPLQFWVNPDTSSLQLAKGSKQHLLGFYPLTTTTTATNGPESKTSKAKEKKKTSAKQQQQQPVDTVPWWQEYWTPTKNRRRTSTGKPAKDPVPTLTVEYSYKGKDFEVTIDDEEPLVLPGKVAAKERTS